MSDRSAKMSAMNLSKRTQRGIASVESVFQSSLIYSDGTKTIGPFPEYLFLPGRQCKKVVKDISKEMHSYYQYSFDGLTFHASAHHISLFYDFLYLNALLEPENREVRQQVLRHMRMFSCYSKTM